MTPFVESFLLNAAKVDEYFESAIDDCRTNSTYQAGCLFHIACEEQKMISRFIVAFSTVVFCSIFCLDPGFTQDSQTVLLKRAEVVPVQGEDMRVSTRQCALAVDSARNPQSKLDCFPSIDNGGNPAGPTFEVDMGESYANVAAPNTVAAWGGGFALAKSFENSVDYQGTLVGLPTTDPGKLNGRMKGLMMAMASQSPPNFARAGAGILNSNNPLVGFDVQYLQDRTIGDDGFYTLTTDYKFSVVETRGGQMQEPFWNHDGSVNPFPLIAFIPSASGEIFSGRSSFKFASVGGGLFNIDPNLLRQSEIFVDTLPPNDQGLAYFAGDPPLTLQSTEVVFQCGYYDSGWDAQVKTLQGADTRTIYVNTTAEFDIKIEIEMRVENLFITGDMNGDGRVSLLDVGLFVTQLNLGYHPAADANYDGQVNLADVAPFTAILNGLGSIPDCDN